MIHYSKIQKTILFVAVAIMLQSCSYSIIVANRNGTAEPSPEHTELGFYNGKKVTVIDTVVSLSVAQNYVSYVAPCPSGGFHSVEYRVTLGEILRNTFSFGKRRTIKVKYVCLKSSN